jgi:hypothetical protein
VQIHARDERAGVTQYAPSLIDVTNGVDCNRAKALHRTDFQAIIMGCSEFPGQIHTLAQLMGVFRENEGL